LWGKRLTGFGRNPAVRLVSEPLRITRIVGHKNR
jgi:hypothetical protein